MNRLTIIGLTGRKGSGKDTAADVLCTYAGFTRMAFADALREEVCTAWRMEPVYLTRRETKEHPMSALALGKCLSSEFLGHMVLRHSAMGSYVDLDAPRSPRQILQWWGTEYRRSMDADYWVRQLALRLDELCNLYDGFGRYVVTDCRFANEAHWLRQSDLGGILWAVQRPAGDGEAAADLHASETDGLAFGPDAIIDNSGDLRQLRERVLGLYLEHEFRLPGLRVVLPEVAALEGVAA